jgi:hypothetical protein
MFTNPGFTLADQLFWIVDLFLKTMAPEACRRRVGSLGLAIGARVKGLERRFSKLYAMWKAGTLPVARARRIDTPTPALPRSAGEGANGAGGGSAAAFDPQACDAASMDRARLRPMSVLPRAFRWLQKMLPVSAGTLASGVESVVWNHPEIKEFVSACPQAARVLRPLCTMAGLKAPEWLALPKRWRARKKDALGLSEADEAELGRLTARFPDTAAARSAKHALRRMFAGLPVNLERMSAVARGYFVHPPRDDNCPPPEIGYGGRRRPLPKDYKPPRDDE